MIPSTRNQKALCRGVDMAGTGMIGRPQFCCLDSGLGSCSMSSGCRQIKTPIRDMYFLQKLLNLKGDDGFRMNEVLVALWYIMGLWPLMYSMLLPPNGRSSKSNVPVWPFLVLSFFGGAYALIPYFVLWKPPPPPVEEDEISRWPLNFLESKITAAISLAAGLGITTCSGLASADVWTEFYHYFRESKFIHVTCVDFSLLSAFAPFWVYNDMSARKWIDKGSWLLLVALGSIVGSVIVSSPSSASFRAADTCALGFYRE